MLTRACTHLQNVYAKIEQLIGCVRGCLHVFPYAQSKVLCLHVFPHALTLLILLTICGAGAGVPGHASTRLCGCEYQHWCTYVNDVHDVNDVSSRRLGIGERLPGSRD